LSIEHLRQQIDELDIQLVELLAKRQQVTTAVGEYKREVGKPIYDPDREADLIGKRRELASSLNVEPDLIEDLLRRIMRESYQSQHNAYRNVLEDGAKVVVVGGKGALGKRFVDMFQRSNYQVDIIEQQDWPNAETIIKGAKLVLMAVPINLTESIIAQLPELDDDCILADLTSLKAEPLKAMLNKHKGPVVGLHPMFGPDVPNFVKQVVVVCNGRYEDKYQWLLQQISIWGAVLQYDEATSHDNSMELIQAMRHFTTFVYGKFLSKANPNLQQLLRLSSPIYRLELAMTGRLFAQDARLYADIIFGAKNALGLATQFKNELDKGIALLSSEDKTAFKQQFDVVADWFGDKSDEFLVESKNLLKTAQDSRDIK
jgi:chorismate mutase/prephenate dehydrogenase